MPFPAGNPGDYFLITEPGGTPAYLVTRQQLQDSTLQNNNAYRSVEFAVNAGKVAQLPIDDIKEAATIHTYNRTTAPPIY
jgi:hypothetical protein